MDSHSPTYRGRHKVLNKKTGRMVYKTSSVGKRICALRKSSCRSNTKKTKPRRKYTKKTKSKRKYTKKTKSKRKYTKKTKSKRKYTKKTKSKRKYTKKRSASKRKYKKSRSSTGKAYRSQSGRVYTSCWSGYKRAGWKMKNGRRVPNCVKA